MKRYSQMTPDELQQEIKRLVQQLDRATTENRDSDIQIFTQKINIAKSYLLDPSTIQPHTWYQVEGQTKLFQVEYINGVFAWGKTKGKTEKIAFPISLLKIK